jgi:hypothetical protein
MYLLGSPGSVMSGICIVDLILCPRRKRIAEKAYVQVCGMYIETITTVFRATFRSFRKNSGVAGHRNDATAEKREREAKRETTEAVR